MTRNDEHTLNTALASALRRRSPLWGEPGQVVAEDLGALSGGGRPDILVRPSGAAPVVVETEVEPAPTVEKDARSRLGEQVVNGQTIESAVAARLPAALRETPQSELEAAFANVALEFAVLSLGPDSGDEATRFPEAGWLRGGLDDLADLIETLGVSERAVARSTEILETAVRQTANYLDRELDARPYARRDIARDLVQEPGIQTDRMAMAIVANACTFHATIAGVLDWVPDLDSLRTETGAMSRWRMTDAWRQILQTDYWPIFRIAVDILSKIPAPVTAHVVKLLAGAAEELASVGATRSHDLTGRMFQRLIQDRKFLATFYTRPEAAALLADLAVGGMEHDWRAGMTGIRVADFACGTGTLLAAAYDALRRRHRRAGGDDGEAHPAMIERSLIAADIMPAATHLTASMLSSAHPAVPYRQTQVYTLPYGEHPAVARPCLGSLSLLESEEILSLFGTGLAAGVEGLGGTGAGAVSEREMGSPSFALADGSLDLVIMNPPFTRPTNHEITGEQVPPFAGFGNTPSEQRAMSKELKRLRNRVARRRKAARDAPPASHGNAGIASNLLDLAHAKLRPGGTLAVVLPAAFALGSAWEASRTLLGTHYRRIRILSLAVARSKDQAFSADTGMAEVLVLAEKREARREGAPAAAPTAWILLDRRPRSTVEAIQTARALRRVLGETGSDRRFEAWLGEQRVAGGIRATLGDGGCAGIADLSLAQTAMDLAEGRFSLPRSGEPLILLTARLGALADRGPLDRDVGNLRGAGREARGPFTILPLRGKPTFPVLWGHRADRERQLVVEPDSMGSVRPERDQDARAVWRTASRLHFNRDFRMNSQSLAACLTPAPAIGGTAWPALRAREPAWERALAAWANTTLGLLLFWWVGSTQQSGRTRITVSRLPDLPVLDLRELPERMVAELGEALDAMSGRDFLPAHRAFEDPARIELDRLVFERALGFGPAAMEQVGLLREKWCAEPTVHGGKRPPR